MAKSTPWGWIIAGIVVFTMILGVILLGVAGFVVYRQFAFSSTPASAHHAQERFSEVAKRFEGQQPLLVIENGVPIVADRAAPGGPPRRPHRGRVPIDALHVMVWEPQDKRVVSLNIPFWLIRMTNGHPIKLSAGDQGEDAVPHLKITADDLERHGPGLILFHSEPSGQRVIVWAQ